MTDAGGVAAHSDGGFVDQFVTAPDGLRLFVRDYGRRAAATVPVVCLAGLARSSADFHELAVALAGDGQRPRRVVALDYRGRGRSDYASNADDYTFPVELADVVAVTTALGVGPAVFVGTSRGGLLTMLLAAQRPTAIAGAVLNDIGPVIEPKGLMRIKGYVGKLPQPRSYQEGAEILRRLFGAQFPQLAANDWLGFAKRTWTERGDRLVLDYDPKLAKTLEGIDLERPLTPMWPQFDALAGVPLMVIRGALSDLLSPATVEAMRARRLDVDVMQVPDQGHAPFLSSPAVIRRVGSFLAHCDALARDRH